MPKTRCASRPWPSFGRSSARPHSSVFNAVFAQGLCCVLPRAVRAAEVDPVRQRAWRAAHPVLGGLAPGPGEFAVEQWYCVHGQSI